MVVSYHVGAGNKTSLYSRKFLWLWSPLSSSKSMNAYMLLADKWEEVGADVFKSERHQCSCKEL